MPLPPVAIHRLSPIEESRIGTNKNYPQIGIIPASKVDKVVLTNSQIKEVDIIFGKYLNGSLNLEETILELRAGGFYDWALITAFSDQKFKSSVAFPQQIVTVTRNNLNSILFQLRAGFIPNKAGFDELPDSIKFSYDMEQGRGLKKQARKVWHNPKAKKEIISMLEKFDKEDRQIQEKPLEGFRKLTELKNSGPGPRVFLYRGKNEKPTVVGFCMRNDLDATIKKLKNKFN